MPVIWVAAAACAGAIALAAFRMCANGPEVTLPAEDPPPPSSIAATVSARAVEQTPSVVMVHVVGAVRKPGVYSLPKGSRGCDALRSAGGVVPGADESALNEARVLADGEQIVVPVKGEARQQAAPEAGQAAGGGSQQAGSPVDINRASAEELDTLPGVGPATAAKIVQDREKNGPFKSLEDLSRIPGIGAKKVEALKDLATAG